MTELLAPWRLGERSSPHTIPLHLVDRVVKKYEPEFFIETGTNIGATVENVLYQFGDVVTIELDPKLAADARKKFEHHPYVTVLEGDSGALLRHLLCGTEVPGIRFLARRLSRERALVWLDAHWSGGATAGGDREIHTPIRGELAAIKESGRTRDILMIDDIEEFDGTRGYPSVGELIDLVRGINPLWRVSIEPLRRGVLVALP